MDNTNYICDRQKIEKKMQNESEMQRRRSPKDSTM